MGLYAPAILTADPPSVGGPEYLLTASEFIADMRTTFTVTGYGFHTSATSGYTSSVDDAGEPVRGNVGFGWYDFLDGGLQNDSLRGDDGFDTCVSGETRRSSCEA